MCRCKPRNDTSSFRSHFFEAPVGETRHIHHQLTEVFDRFWIKRKSVFTFSHKIRHTAASIRNDYRQACCHSFFNHKTPLLCRAPVHEHTTKRIASWNLPILAESPPQNIHTQIDFIAQ